MSAPRYRKEDVLAALRAEDVADRLGICALGDQRWRARWLRSTSCAKTHHRSLAFAIARDGMWHCHSCDEGGDLLDLIAASLGVNTTAAFGDVLTLAAEIAGLEAPCDNPFEEPRPKLPPRPPPPPIKPLAERIEAARRRAAWTWQRLNPAAQFSLVAAYLRERGLDPDAVLAREDVRATPLRIPPELRQAIERRDDRLAEDLRVLWWTMGVRAGTLSIVVPVRGVDDGAMLDLRARRVQPLDGQPKIVGMVGGVTAEAAQRGKPRRLMACYGHPHAIELSHVVVGEGLMDYLTALQIFPNAQVLCAVEAGSLALVAGHAARALAARGEEDCQLTIVEQADPQRVNAKTGAPMTSAADAAINEDPNAATKVAVRALGAGKLAWLLCEAPGDDGVIGSPCAALGGKPVKDLNDLVRVGRDPRAMIARWTDIGDTTRRAG